MAESRNFYLICYDIREPKRWRKAYKLLQGYGDRLQYSVFRCLLTVRHREKLRWELEKILTPEDSLLIAGLCDRCVQRVVACNRPESWSTLPSGYQIF
ncbi:MAG: CRISPR-associated endonuclease Cas2 [Pseudanabaenaceae cyanobacterium]